MIDVEGIEDALGTLSMAQYKIGLFELRSIYSSLKIKRKLKTKEHVGYMYSIFYPSEIGSRNIIRLLEHMEDEERREFLSEIISRFGCGTEHWNKSTSPTFWSTMAKESISCKKRIKESG